MKTLLACLILSMSFSTFANDMNAWATSLENCTTDLITLKLRNIETITSDPATRDSSARAWADTQDQTLKVSISQIKEGKKICAKRETEQDRISCRVKFWDVTFNLVKLEGLYGEEEVKYVPACEFLEQQ